MSVEAISREVDITNMTAVANSMIPTLRDRHHETDELCKLPDSTLADFEAAGIFRMLTPRAYGGQECSIEEFMRTVVELGRGDGSAAWAVTLIDMCIWMAATLYPRSVTDKIFIHPDIKVAGVVSPRFCKARRTDGGIIVEKGVWGFNSGVYHADWDLLGVPILNDNNDVIDQGLAAVPIGDVELLHDWDTMAIRGSGSTSVALTDIFIPDAHIVSLTDAINGKYEGGFQDSALYRSAFMPLLSIILTFPTMGMGEAMQDLFMEKLPKRGIAYTPYGKQAEAVVTQVQLSQAMAKTHAARLVVENAVREIEDWARRDEVMPFMQRARIRRDTGFAGQTIWESVDLLASAAGGSLAATSNPLNRVWRDARVAIMHGIFCPMTNHELYGRLMCGLQPDTALI
jgi:alkylation response protein AidB-like acyl-CoA dehydrogenase